MNLLLALLCAVSIANADTARDGATIYNIDTGYTIGIGFTPKSCPVVTDSVVWRTVSVDSLNVGSGSTGNCYMERAILWTRSEDKPIRKVYRKHDWVYSDTWRARGGINVRCYT